MKELLHDNNSSYTGSKAWEAKIDHRLRSLLAAQDLQITPTNRTVNVFIHFHGPIEALQKIAGLTIRTVAGEIATATIALSDLPGAAKSPQIIFIEQAGSLGIDS